MAQCERVLAAGYTTVCCENAVDFRGGEFFCTEHALEALREDVRLAEVDRHYGDAAEFRRDIAVLLGEEGFEEKRLAA